MLSLVEPEICFITSAPEVEIQKTGFLATHDAIDAIGIMLLYNLDPPPPRTPLYMVKIYIIFLISALL